MDAERLVWRLGFAPELLHERSEQLRAYARRHGEIAALYAYELDLVMEQRARIRRLNRRRAELGSAPLELPETPRRDLPPAKTGLPDLSSHRSRAVVKSAPVCAFASELGDSIVEGLTVEYGRRTLVADRPGLLPYVEEFRARAVEVPRAAVVPLVLEDDDYAIGQAVSFRNGADGLHVRCRLARSDEPTIRALIAAGMLVAVTPVFAALRTSRAGPVVVRERVRLLAVSLCRWPVYRESQLTLSRTA
jgi:phage head maturation protease